MLANIMNNEKDELERIRRKKLQELQNSKEKDRRNNQKTAPTTPLTVTDASLLKIVRMYPLVVIDFWAPWCGPCHMMAPILEELAKEYSGKIVIAKLNVDENQRTAERYGVMSIPTLLIFKKGKLVDSVMGAMPKEMLVTILTKHL
jgi:thioredoxin 1